MTSLDRALSGALHLHLDAGRRAALIDEGLLARTGRTARALVKEGPLRVTLVALASGAALAEHHADGPIALHLLEGRVRFRAAGSEWTLGEGDLLSLPTGVPHSVEAEERAVFLLTVAAAAER